MNNKTRIAIVDPKRCKPKNCDQQCKRNCPVVKMGKLCIQVKKRDKIAEISELLCNGCGICVKKCPFNAIKIINLPKNLDADTIHRYSANSFKLHRLPIPRRGQVLGLVGANGTGKSTAVKILAKKLRLNLGDWNYPPEPEEVIAYFRGSELQNYFTKMYEGDLKTLIKPQYVDTIAKVVKGKVRDLILRKDERGMKDEIMDKLDLNHLYDREIKVLSGGELQRFAIGITALQEADVYIFDEPSSYLDVKQRLKAAKVIRSLTDDDKYVIAIEHDLSVLDYLSDHVCVLYGTPGAYGVVTAPASVREGINNFISGFIPTENMRFRNSSLSFSISTDEEVITKSKNKYQCPYPAMTKTNGNFTLKVEGGGFGKGEVIVLLGENGTGKSTFLKLLAGITSPDDNNNLDKLLVSYKPQEIAPSFPGSVRQLLHTKVKTRYTHPQFQTDVYKPLNIEDLMDRDVKTLSGGELQRVALCLSLAKSADVYLIDEPSAYLDSEQRIYAAKAIKNFIQHSGKTAFVVEHDLIMATYLADKVIVYDGVPSVECTARKPEALVGGMNKFLQNMGITFRRDESTNRPRINKEGSVKDTEQKASGNYFSLG